MNTYLVLLRGINVGGKNNVPMAALKTCLETLGFSNVSTYLASGNAILDSDKSPARVKTLIERKLPEHFKLDSELVKVLVLAPDRVQSIIDDKPRGFGDRPERYLSDVIFLIDIDMPQALPVFNPREGVDKIWPGDGVIYSQRLSAMRTKSRLREIVGKPAYKSMTIRTWQTTTALAELLKSRASQPRAAPGRHH